MIALQAIEMIQLQEKFNQRVDPNWRERDFNFGRAVFVEAAEFVEHMGWKWWKHQTPDRAQARMELVDIWHFGLSMIMKDAPSHQAAALQVVNDWATSPTQIFMRNTLTGVEAPISEFDTLALSETLAAYATATGKFPILIFRVLCDRLEMTPELLYTLYVSKNALNDFRQANGYKQGTYQKMWHGQEDNQVLMNIVDELDHVSYESITKALEQAYKHVVA